MPIGKVKFFNADKGYGFIAPEDGSADAFVHITAVEAAGLRTLATSACLTIWRPTRRAKSPQSTFRPSDVFFAQGHPPLPISF